MGETMNIVELFVRLKAMGLGGTPFKIADLPDASSVTESTTLPALLVGENAQVKATAEQLADYVAASGKVVPDVFPESGSRVPRKVDGVWGHLSTSGAPTSGTIATRTGGPSNGTLRAGDAIVDDDLVTLRQFNAKFAAVNALDPATATLEELITALQAPAAPAALNMIVEEDEML